MSLQILESETNKSWAVTLARRTAVVEDEVVKDYTFEYIYSIYSRDMEFQREKFWRKEIHRQELQRVEEIRNCNYYTTALDLEEFTKTLSQYSYQECEKLLEQYSKSALRSFRKAHTICDRQLGTCNAVNKRTEPAGPADPGRGLS